MMSRLTLLLGLTLAAAAPFSFAQTIGETPPAAPVSGVLRSAEELDQILGPIALYPDALLAIMLPASTKPVDIVMAIRYLQDGRSLSDIDEQPWDDSIRALAHHREALEFLDENLLWTKDLAEAFTNQPADVMSSIQRLRRAAFNAGTLKDTPQHKLIVTNDEIRIVPADPERIYVPRYDTRVVYVERPVYYSTPPITFGVGFAVGSWLNYDCDWRHRSIYVINRSWLWHSSPSLRAHRFHYGPRYYTHYWRRWSPVHHHLHARPVHVAPVYPRHYPRPDHRITPRFNDSHRDRHDHRDHARRHDDRRDHVRRDLHTPRFDDSRRRPDAHRQNLAPQNPTAARVATARNLDDSRRRPDFRRDHTPRPTPQATAPTSAASTPANAAGTPRRFHNPGQDRRPDFNRGDSSRPTPQFRRTENSAPRVANTERPAPRVHTPAPAPRVQSSSPAPQRPAPRAEPSRSDRGDSSSSRRGDSSSSRRGSSDHRPNQRHAN